jgi:fucose permease
VRARAAAIAIAAFLAIGVPDGMLGPAWPWIRHDLHQPLAALGEVSGLLGLGALLSGLVAGRLRERVGAGLFLAGGALAGAITEALFGASPWWIGMLVLAFLVGAARAAVDAGMNAQAALHAGPRLLNALHGSYGIGATAGPLVVAAATSLVSWRAAWAVAATLWALVGGLLVLGRRDFPTALPARWLQAATVEPRKSLLVWQLSLFFLITGLEVAIGSWTPTLLEHRGWSRSAASAWTSIYWASFTVGRIALAAMGARAAPSITLRVGAAAVLGGVGLLALSPVGLLLAGLGLAGLFPALVALTPTRLGADRAASFVGYQLSAATAGGATVVAATGLAAQWLGIGATVPVLAGCAACLVGAELRAAGYGRPRRTV